jgi:Fic family protein
MEKLITWVNKEDLEMHPVIKAAVFQNRFVWTPPFFDANGCTARLVFNLLFLKKGFPTGIILKVNGKKYYKHLIMPLTGIKKLFVLVGIALTQSLDIYLSDLDDTAGDYAPISSIVREPPISYGQEYVILLARQDKIDTYKEARVWYTTEKGIKDYVPGKKGKLE